MNVKLGELIAEETGAPLEEILLLRHSNDRIKEIEELGGGSIDEYSMVQPIGGKYDYFHPNKPSIRFVVVIIRDEVYAVYEILGVDAEASTYDLASEALRRLSVKYGHAERPARSYKFRTVQSSSVGKAVRWTAPRTPVSRSEHPFFDSIEVIGI